MAADTPTLHLSYGTDAAENANWDILDSILTAIGTRTVIPDDVLIQGSLEVTGNAQIDGILTALGGFSPPLGQVTFPNLGANAASFFGPVSFQPGSIDPSALAPGASVYTAQTGIAQTGQLTLTVTPQDLGEIILSPPDDPNRWELVIASLQFQVGMSGDNVGGLNAVAQINLRRGQSSPTTVQSRQGSYTATRAGYLELPMTMVRLTKPPAADVARWSIEGHLLAPVASLTITRTFTQLSVIQFT